MRVSVYGLGYVGIVSAACLADDGHDVVGVDPNRSKVAMVNAGRSPIVEPGLDELVGEVVRAGRLRATVAASAGVADADVAWVCVGTPSRANGDYDLTFLRRVTAEIGAELRGRDRPLVVALRSTVTPGTAREVMIPLLEEASGKRHGRGFTVCVCPEFLREGSAIADFVRPAKVILGHVPGTGAEVVLPLVARGEAPIVETSLELAELSKPVDNAWHALKAAFANEIGRLSKAHGLDGREAMQLLCADTKLNVSPAYLTPGPAFGGSCLPKDVRALVHRARDLDLDLPVLAAVLPSNAHHLDRAVQMVLDHGARRVGVIGLSFKPGTDDLRESPLVELVERLIGKGYDLRIYDPSVNVADLTGANRAYALAEIPHIASLLTEDVDDVLAHAEVLVVGQDLDACALGRLAGGESSPSQVELVIDLTLGGTAGEQARLLTKGGRHAGLCW